METLQTECTPEEHSHIITDVCFRPHSTQLATSSFDKSVRVWDASEVNFYLAGVKKILERKFSGNLHVY